MNEMPETFAALRDEVGNQLSLIFENEGFSPLVGKIITLLLFAPEPVSLQDLARKLGVSKAAVSVQIRGMGRNALCHKIHTGNDRKDYYYISDDLCMKVIQSVTEKLLAGQQLIAVTLQTLLKLDEVEPGEEASRDIVKERMTEMSYMYELSMLRLKELQVEWGLWKKKQGLLQE